MSNSGFRSLGPERPGGSGVIIIPIFVVILFLLVAVVFILAGIVAVAVGGKSDL